MIVVADSSPLIFLGKVRRLALIRRVAGPVILVAASVRDEVLEPPIDPGEAEALADFLAACEIVKVARPRRFATAMSAADNAALTLALRRSADFLLCDDRIVRQVAATEGVRPLGTLGILLRAREKGLLERTETRRLVDALIRAHGFRIGVELYQAVLKAIGK